MFQKAILRVAAGLALAGCSYAGQVQIGSGNDGLTAAYFTSLAGGATNTWQQRSYMAGLFSVVTEGASPTVGVTSAGSSVKDVPRTDAAAGTNNSITDDDLGITYRLINDGLGTATNGNNGHGNNVWASVGTASTLVVPINNLGGVDWIGIMINDYWGFSGANPTIKLHFLTAGDVSVVLPDTASGTGSNNATGPIRSATECKSSTGSVTCAGKTTSGANVSAGDPITGPPPSVTLTTSLATTFNVSWATIWSDSYSTNSGTANGPYNCNTVVTGPCTGTAGSSTGTVMLDDLKINLNGNYTGDTLQSISFTQNTVATGASNSRLALSAITVDQIASTPEPGTIVMFGLGLGLLGIRRLRRS